MIRSSCEDTIVAISTPVGYGGIGIVRLSGKKALAVADQIFLSKGKKKPSGFKSFSVRVGWIVKKTKGRKETSVVDEALLTVMRSPKSYTKEDVVEISSHGGIVSLRAIVNLAIEHGARLADPGEFTKRAFLNGRMDLTQAEAVLDIIQSKTDAFLKVSVNQLKGELATELEIIRKELMDIYTELEAVVNFPEDDIEADGRKRIKEKIEHSLKKIDKLLKSSEHGRILKEGIKIVICGKPNVGKSSLLNVLLKQPRAIVSEIAGTTRDTIEETASIQGIPFQLVDTAGILEPRDLIEEEAVKRSRMFMQSADLVLLVLDASRRWSKEDGIVLKNVKSQNIMVVVNKTDLPLKLDMKKVESLFKDKKIAKTSVVAKKSISVLEKEIVEHVWHGRVIQTHGILISNVRHIQSLKQCEGYLVNMKNSLIEDLPYELISEDVKEAVECLDQITGRSTNLDLINNIFSRFCIGK